MSKHLTPRHHSQAATRRRDRFSLSLGLFVSPSSLQRAKQFLAIVVTASLLITMPGTAGWADNKGAGGSTSRGQAIVSAPNTAAPETSNGASLNYVSSDPNFTPAQYRALIKPKASTT